MLLNFLAAFVVALVWTGTLLAAIFAGDEEEEDCDG